MKISSSLLKTNNNNPRILKNASFKKLVKSLKEFPEMADVREVVVNKEYLILGGNQRYRAMLEAGWSEIPVKIVDWAEEKQREFIIKDNISSGQWSEDIFNWDSEELEGWGLDLEPKELKDIDFDSIESNQDRQKADNIKEFTCPNCSHKFRV